MTGLTAWPDRTLGDRAVEHLQTGPRSAADLTRDILGLRNAPLLIAERLTVALLGADPRARQLPDGRWAVAAAAREASPLPQCSFAVVDVETTGAQAREGDRVMEIAVVAVSGTRVEMVLDTLVNPGRPIPRWATSVTGITDALVRAAPPFDEVADQVLAALAGRVFVAHNARFDWRFVDAEVRRTRDLVLDGTRICTVRLARRLLPGPRSCGLDALSRFFGFENPARHRAGGDALVTAWLLQRLLGLADEQGVHTLEELGAL